MSIQEPDTEKPVAAEPPESGAAEGSHPTDWTIFGIGAVLVVAFIIWGVASTDSLSAVASAVLGGVIKGGGWAFVLAATGFVVFALWLAFSRYGRSPSAATTRRPSSGPARGSR